MQVMFVLRFTTGALLAASEAHGLPDVRHLLPGLLCWWAATTCVHLFNGATDLPEDRADGSARPPARGVLPERTARRVVGAPAATALLAVCATGLVVAESALVFLALGFACSAPSVAAEHRTWSASPVTSAAAATTYPAGASAAGGAPTAEALVFATVLPPGVGLIAAVAKDWAARRVTRWAAGGPWWWCAGSGRRGCSARSSADCRRRGSRWRPSSCTGCRWTSRPRCWGWERGGSRSGARTCPTRRSTPEPRTAPGWSRGTRYAVRLVAPTALRLPE